jgi:hypothetical protein
MAVKCRKIADDAGSEGMTLARLCLKIVKHAGRAEIPASATVFLTAFAGFTAVGGISLWMGTCFGLE